MSEQTPAHPSTDGRPARPVKIGVVGPCAAGKSTLIARLRAAGYTCKHIAQEHSYVKDMWRRLAHPDLLVYLQVSYPLTLERRRLDWNEDEYQEEIRRLAHAHQHADLIIDTDPLSPEQVAEQVLSYLARVS